MNNWKVNRTIYFIYIFFLPFGNAFAPTFMPAVLKQYLFKNTSLYFFVIGIILLLFLNKGKMEYGSGIAKWMKYFAYTSAYSFIAALILFIPLGECNGEDTFRAVIGPIMNTALMVLAIYYNYIALKDFVDFKELFKIFDIQIIILLIVGYLQFICSTTGALSGVYSALANALNLLPLSNLNRGVTFFGTEPSSASLLCYVIIPYIFSRIIDEVGWHKVRYILAIALFMFLTLNSTSSSFLILFLLCWAAFIGIVLSKGTVYRGVLISAFVIGMVIAVGYGLDNMIQVYTGTDKESIMYYVFGKIVDRTSQSTMMRSSSIINDMKIFFANPITGVGNGIQGYFFNDNCPNWAKASSEVQSWLSGKNGIMGGGGAYFPTLLSSFGLFSLLVLVPLFKVYKTAIEINEFEDNEAKNMFLIFIVLFAAAGWFSMSLGDQNAAFIMSIPLAVSMNEEYNDAIWDTNLEE